MPDRYAAINASRALSGKVFAEGVVWVKLTDHRAL